MKIKSFKTAVFLPILILMVAVASFVLLKEPLDNWFRLQANSSAPQGTYTVNVAFPNLVFDNPLGIYDANDRTNRLFVVEQRGVIRVFENNPPIASSSVFLDISDKVLTRGGEQGLLGLAFPSDFEQTGLFYVNYVADEPSRTVLSRFSVSQNNPNLADKQSEFILLEVLQPTEIHNGGQIAFGPDGYLYIAKGDGGPAADPFGRGQDLETLLGKILRIDVSLGGNYTIPSDNPFVGNIFGYREEIYSYGFRNPWRFSFDSETGRLWVADVGQVRLEEINIVEIGKNYGWSLFEGILSFPSDSDNDPTGLEFPVWVYGRDAGTAVIGGFVYHGSSLRELVGAYIYGDFGSGRIWALYYDGIEPPANFELVHTNLDILSFGIDKDNQLFICALDGRIYRLQVIESVPPVIGAPIQMPLEPLPNQEVTVTVNVTDAISGVREVVLSYSNDTVWINITMALVEGDKFSATIPRMPYQTMVRYRIIATDYANNTAVEDNLGAFYTYTVVPEFPSVILLVPLLLIVTLFIIAERRRGKLFL